MIKRRFKNYLLFPGAQLKHGVLFVGVSTLIHVLLTIASIVLVDAWLSGKSGVGHLPFWQVLVVIVIFYLFSLILIFFFGLYMAHRWLGPLVPIERFVDGLARGEVGAKLALRKGDLANLTKIVNSLNLLAEKIEKDKRKIE